MKKTACVLLFAGVMFGLLSSTTIEHNALVDPPIGPLVSTNK